MRGRYNNSTLGSPSYFVASCGGAPLAVIALREVPREKRPAGALSLTFPPPLRSRSLARRDDRILVPVSQAAGKLHSEYESEQRQTMPRSLSIPSKYSDQVHPEVEPEA